MVKLWDEQKAKEMAEEMLDARARLENLTDALVDDIMSLSDGELEAELREDGLDPTEEAERVRKLIDQAIERHRRFHSIKA